MKSPDDVYAASPRALPRTVGTRIPLPRPRHLVTACGRICMHRKKSTSRPCSPASGSASTTLTRHLARQLHAPRPRLNRPGTENLADHRQPVPHQVVTHVLGTICYLCLRAVHNKKWCPRQDSNLRPQDSYHFDFRRRCKRSWSGLSLHRGPERSLGAARPVSTPSQRLRAWLGVGWPLRLKRSPTLSRFTTAFPTVVPNSRNPVLYPTELRGPRSFISMTRPDVTGFFSE